MYFKIKKTRRTVGSFSLQSVIHYSLQQKTTGKNVLDIEDFRETDILGEKSLIVVSPKSHRSSEEDLHEDTSVLSLSHLTLKLATLKLDTEYVSDGHVITEHQLASLSPPFHPDYAVNCHHPDSVFISEQGRLRHLSQEDDSSVLQKEESRQADDEMSQQKGMAVKCAFCDFAVNTNTRCSDQMTCETEYIMI